MQSIAAEPRNHRWQILKFEFGAMTTGEITLGDEALTPDSSRFWEAAAWKP
jgi:phosphoribosylaminoimidazole-succinocarboxamide synthase